MPRRNSASLDLGRREDGDEGSHAILVGAGLAAGGGAVGDQGRGGPCADAVIHVDDERPGEQVWSMPRMAAVPSPPRPYPVEVGSPITGTATRPETTLGRAPSIPAATTRQSGSNALSSSSGRGEAMDAGHPDVVEAHHGCTHLAGHRERLLEDGQVRGARAQGTDAASARRRLAATDHQ